MKHCISIWGVMVAMSIQLMAQVEYPRINHPMPHMEIGVENRPERSSVTQLKGKYAVIYFFGKGCLGSFLQLQEVNELYKKYRQTLHIVAVGIDKGDHIAEAYDRYREKFKLVMPVSYDSVYHKKFRISGVPCAIWINPDGVVKAVTAQVKEKQVIKFLNNEAFEFVDTSVEGKQNRKRFRINKPFLIDGNGGDAGDFQYRSVMTQWKPGMPVHTIGGYIPGIHPLANIKELHLLGRELTELYRVAYWGRSFPWGPSDSAFYGKYSWEIRVEVNDLSAFVSPENGEPVRYAYSQSIPEAKRTPEERMRILQADLKNYFNYEVAFEKRKMPCLKLIADKNAKERLAPNPAKGLSVADDITGGEFNNINIMTLIGVISHTARLNVNNLPLLNETGITGNIDIELRAVMTDLEDIKQALRRNGLDIIAGEREMNIMVIRESSVEKMRGRNAIEK